MSSYNRENPFMYLLETKMDELRIKSEKSVKEMLIMLIVCGFAFITEVTVQILKMRLNIILLVIMPIMVFFCISQIKDAISSIKSEEMNERIFGDQYQNINLNNEELLSNINHYNLAIGRVEYVIKYIYTMDICYSIVLAINIVTIMIYIFS